MGDAIIIAGKRYPLDDINKLSMRELLLMENQSEAATGRRLTVQWVKQLQADIAALDTDEQRAEHPDAFLLFGVAIYVARRRAGEDVTFTTALEFDVDDLELDIKPRKPLPNPTKGRADSGPASGRGTSMQGHKPKASKTKLARASS